MLFVAFCQGQRHWGANMESVMKRLIRVLGAAMMLMLVHGGVHAQFSGLLLPNFKWDVQPTPGGYYDPAQPGTGVMVDTLAQGSGAPFVFLAYYHYEPNGQADWLTMGATVTQASLAEYTATGVPAQIRSQWIRSVGGQCLDCAHLAPTTALVPGERTLNLVGGRHIEFPAAGNASQQRMKMAKDFGADGSISKTLLDSGIVWSVRTRSFFEGAERNFNAGWLRFRRRVERLSEVSSFVPPNAIVPPPAFLTNVPLHNTGPQWEVACVRSESGSNSVGSCSISGLLDSVTQTSFDTNNNTFVVDATNDRIRYTSRCVLTPCLPSGPSHANSIGEVLEVAPTSDGRRRMVLRVFGPGLGGWTDELEFTQVGADYLAATFPNGVP